MNKVEELLLKAKKEDFQKKKTEVVTSKFLGEKLGLGEPAEVVLKELSARRATELANTVLDSEGNLAKENIFDANLHLVAEAVVSPSMKNKEYMEHYGAASPKELAELIFGTDVTRIANKVKEMAGITDETAEKDKKEVKN